VSDEPRNGKEVAEAIVAEFHSRSADGLLTVQSRHDAYTETGKIADRYADKARQGARDHAEVWMHKYEDIQQQCLDLASRKSILREALEWAAQSFDLLSKDNRDEGFESVANIRKYAATHAAIARDALLRAGKGKAG
jgi:DNA phosphorothioation-dependent restriction protein DptG